MVSFLPLTLCETLPTKDMRRGSLYEYLETECGLHLVYAENYIEVAFATREQAKYLEVPPGSTLLLIEGLVYDQTGRPVELSRVLYRGDRFKLFFESFRKKTASSRIRTDPQLETRQRPSQAQRLVGS